MSRSVAHGRIACLAKRRDLFQQSFEKVEITPAIKSLPEIFDQDWSHLVFENTLRAHCYLATSGSSRHLRAPFSDWVTPSASASADEVLSEARLESLQRVIVPRLAPLVGLLRHCRSRRRPALRPYSSKRPHSSILLRRDATHGVGLRIRRTALLFCPAGRRPSVRTSFRMAAATNGAGIDALVDDHWPLRWDGGQISDHLYLSLAWIAFSA